MTTDGEALRERVHAAVHNSPPSATPGTPCYCYVCSRVLAVVEPLARQVGWSEPTVPADAYWQACEERDALARQVERVEALCDTWDRYSVVGLIRQETVDALRAALSATDSGSADQ